MKRVLVFGGACALLGAGLFLGGNALADTTPGSAGQCVSDTAGAAGPDGTTSSGQVTSGPPYTFTAPAGSVIVEICVKQGSSGTGGPYYFNVGGQIAPINGAAPEGCFILSGFGNRTGSVGLSENANNIQGCGISHVVLYYKDGQTPSTPSPSPGPSPSATPSPSPHPTHSPSPDPTPSPSPNSSPRPTPSSHPSPSPSPFGGVLANTGDNSPIQILALILLALGVIAVIGGTLAWRRGRM